MPNFANANGSVVFTVPAGRVWIGAVALSASVAGAAGDASMAAHPSVTVSGSGADNWSNGDTVVAAALAMPAVSMTALTGVSAAATASSGKIVIRARANAINLVLNLPARVVGNATATGELI